MEINTLRELQLEPMSIDDLIERVRLWDSLKQAIAVQALLYYVHYIEKSSALYTRLRAFLDSLEAVEVIAAEPDTEPPQAEAAP